MHEFLFLSLSRLALIGCTLKLEEDMTHEFGVHQVEGGTHVIQLVGHELVPVKTGQGDHLEFLPHRDFHIRVVGLVIESGMSLDS